MTYRSGLVKALAKGVLALFALAALAFGRTGDPPDTQKLDEVLARTGTQMSAFLDEFSDVKCTEQVRQEKLGKDDKVERKEDSTYDYLIILTNTGGELNLSESRLPIQQAKPDRRNTPMLVSNGFAMLFLVFHPLYAESFKFALLGDDSIGGRQMRKVSFEHIPGTKSVAALALRGREYPLELSGTAWIDAQTGSIAKIDASIQDTLLDVGMKSLRSEIEFAPVPFADSRQVYWYPTVASVEVETPRQHWRNLHRFTDYKKFSVSTEEQVVHK